MTLNRSMVSLMTQLILYVIKFKPTQLPVIHLRTHKCFERLIIQNSLKQWRLKLAITRIVVTVISCYKKTYLLALRQSWPFGCSNASNSPTEHSISIRPDYVLMEVKRLGVKTSGTHMLLSLHGLVFHFCFCNCLESKSINFVLAFPQADLGVPVYQFTWSFLHELIQLMSLMGTGADTFSNSIRTFMASSKLATTGSKNFVKGLSLVTLSKAKLMNVSYFGRTASFSPMLMTVLSSEKTWQSLMQSFLCKRGS